MKEQHFYPKPGKDFVSTEEIEQITTRAETYLEAEFPVNLSGPTGSGKTTLALHLASQFDQAAVMIQGDEELGTSELIGKEGSFSKKKVVDNYIPSVLKTEERATTRWHAKALTEACKKGHILIYDEFSRSRPEANNVLLSVLEEGILNLSTRGSRDSYIQVHPEFKAIFTSNPTEYVGVYGTQDALVDRMITIELNNYSEETETKITARKAGIHDERAGQIVSLIRRLRKQTSTGLHQFTLRSAIKIARAASELDLVPSWSNELFRKICLDVLTKPNGNGEGPDTEQFVLDQIQETL